MGSGMTWMQCLIIYPKTSVPADNDSLEGCTIVLGQRYKQQEHAAGMYDIETAPCCGAAIQGRSAEKCVRLAACFSFPSSSCPILTVLL